MARDRSEIRALLAPLTEGSVLLPNSVVAEVIGWSSPNPRENAPGWLLGELDWNDWQVPVINFARMSGASDRDPAFAGSHILIVKTLSKATGIMFIGILINGLPKLKTLAPDQLETLDDSPAAAGVFARVRLGDQEAIIPELDSLTAMVEQAIHSP